MQVYSRSVVFGLHAVQKRAGQEERLLGHIRGHRQKLVALLFSAELVVVVHR